MQKTILSTADVARLFNVTETTVKRWADDGSLKCQKTPGGHRKFVIKYVIDFADKNNMEPLGVLEIPESGDRSSRLQMAVLERDMNALKDQFVERALLPAGSHLNHFFSYLYEHKIPLVQIYDEVLQNGMRIIGERWERGELSIHLEHRASYETMDALTQLQSEIHTKNPNGRFALLACVGEELHEMGLRCASNIFKAEGWETEYLGARTPSEAVLDSIRESKHDVVCVSVTKVGQSETLGPLLKDIAETAHAASAYVMLGGRAARETGYQQKAFDLVSTSTRELLEVLDKWESLRQ